jgi:hypothetical protein
MPWHLDLFSFLQGSPCFRRDAVCSVIVAFVFLVGAYAVDDAVPADPQVFATGLVRRSLSAFALPPSSRVAGLCPARSAPLGVLKPKPPWG